MKKLSAVLLLAAGLFVTGTGIAEAAPGGYRHGGGHRGNYHSYPRYSARIVVGAPFYRPFYRPYYYPSYYYPPVYSAPAYYAPPAPTEYIEMPRQELQYQPQPQQFYQQPAPQPQSQPQYEPEPEPQSQARPEAREYSYYCPSPQGYYPDVPNCPGGWQRTER
jgi:hypothetical protein